jgi:hypothetical protein
MISNSRVDPSSRRRGLSNLLHKNSHSQKKSSIRSTNHKDQKKIKPEKDTSNKKKRTKSKKKRSEQLNTNNNNATITDQSLTSFTSDLPQIAYSSRTENDDTSECMKYIRGPMHHVFYRQANPFNTQGYNEQFSHEKHSNFLNYRYQKPIAF